LTEGQFDELQKILVDHPYFSIARSIAARGAKDLGLESKNSLISSAAIYATDRKHLKKYINGELVFLADPPKISEQDVDTSSVEVETVQSDPNTVDVPETSSAQRSSVLDEIPTHVPTGQEVDQVLDELEQDIKELEKSRMHFLEVQEQLDQAKFTSKEEPKDAPPVVEEKKETIEPKSEEPSGESTTIPETTLEKEEEEEEVSKPKKAAKPEFTLDLEALKREFALESEKEEDVDKAPEENLKEPIIIGNMDDDDDDDADFFPPPPTDSPNAITNMSPDEEEPDDEAEIIQKLPQKSKRKPRKATKMKRDDFEKILGKKSDPEKDSTAPEASKEAGEALVEKLSEKPKKEVDAPAEKETSKVKTPKETKTKKKKVEKKVEEKSEEPISPQETKEEKQRIAITKQEEKKAPVKEETTDKVKEVMSKMDKASSISKSQSRRKTKNRPKKDMEENVAPIEIIKSAPKKSPKKDSSAKKEVKNEESEEMSGRNSVKSFLELGRAESTSISRASASKKRARTNRSKSSGDATKTGSKDDDESGGGQDLIDKFISENPSIQRRDTNEKSDLSEESVKWRSELASEYLAQIYADQGNKARAISIYEALSLKFPEKKSYFAGLIKKLKK
jgi:hypothetical protein